MPKRTSFNSLALRVTLTTLGANIVGAFLTFIYFQFLAPPPTGRTPLSRAEPWEWFAFLLMLGVLLFAATMFIAFLLARLRSEQSGLLKKAEPISRKVQQHALNLVPQLALINLFLWVFAGALVGTIALRTGETLGEMTRLLVGIIGIGGIFTTAFVFFINDLLWRPALGIFFPDGKIADVPAFRLPILGRLAFVFLLSAIAPPALLVFLSLTRLRDFAAVPPNPAARTIILANAAFIELFILAATTIFAIGMAIFVTRSITQPLRNLQDAMTRVEQNDFNVSVPVFTNDELGYVSERFNQMTAGLRQGDLMRNLLNLYVSPEVAREALEKGARLGGDMIECTVLFSDMRDFTGLSERLAPNDLIALVNRYMTLMVGIITAQDGMVNKFGGDSLLAIFGTPLNPAPDHAARAVRTALAMREALIQFNGEQAKAGAPIIRVGIGVATGSVVAGNVGSAQRIEYTVLGDTVNLAARLEQKTKDIGCDILLSESTCSAAREKIAFRAELLTGVTVKGKNDAVAVYSLG